jgi:hypothetical protein
MVSTQVGGLGGWIQSNTCLFVLLVRRRWGGGCQQLVIHTNHHRRYDGTTLHTDDSTTIDSMMVRPYILTTAARALIQTDLSRTETADLASNNTITHPPIVYVVGLYGEMVKPRNFI